MASKRNYKVVCISDSHGQHERVDLPLGDLLLFAGDLSSTGDYEQVVSFLKWFRLMSRRYSLGAVMIAGNHDKSFDLKYKYDFINFMEIKDPHPDKKPEWLWRAISAHIRPSYGVHYLENSSVVVGDGLKIWGSPITPWFYGDYWAFNKPRGEEIRQVWETIPDDTDIVLTHGPAYRILDYVPSAGQHVGCQDLAEVLEIKKPILHVCGHIHEGYGITKLGGTIHINASLLNDEYRPVNEPIVINIQK